MKQFGIVAKGIGLGIWWTCLNSGPATLKLCDPGKFLDLLVPLFLSMKKWEWRWFLPHNIIMMPIWDIIQMEPGISKLLMNCVLIIMILVGEKRRNSKLGRQGSYFWNWFVVRTGSEGKWFGIKSHNILFIRYRIVPEQEIQKEKENYFNCKERGTVGKGVRQKVLASVLQEALWNHP